MRNLISEFHEFSPGPIPPSSVEVGSVVFLSLSISTPTCGFIQFDGVLTWLCVSMFHFIWVEFLCVCVWGGGETVKDWGRPQLLRNGHIKLQMEIKSRGGLY